MKIDLFSIPIYILNVDVDKIKLKNQTFKKRWLSGTEASHESEVKIDDESATYLLSCVSKLISKDIRGPHNLELSNIWENHYKENDFQEIHNHPQSHFSFVIYKKIDKSNTVFINPSVKLITSYYETNLCDNLSVFEENFKPECRQGQLLVFPSFVDHMVLKNNNSDTVSGNINIKMVK